MSRSSWRAAPNSSAVGGSPPTRSPRHQRSSTPAAAMAPSTARSRSWRPCTSEQTPILTRASFWLAPPEGWLVPTEGPLASSTPLRAHSSRRMSTVAVATLIRDRTTARVAPRRCGRVPEYTSTSTAASPRCAGRGGQLPRARTSGALAPGCARFGAISRPLRARSREPGRVLPIEARRIVLSGARR